MSKRVSLVLKAEDPKIFNKTRQNHCKNKRVVIGVLNINVQSPESMSFSSTASRAFSAEKFLKRVEAKVTRLVQSRSHAESKFALDSQRAEVVEDCIEFLNSSSCLQKSNSAS
ncbi:Sulfoquinovosyldiacylglycerol 2 [Heracleum sosnowskyi]|uniref:Sulfoquinovosyldiacylglycerol 2 n=1 Tax=Heracleum sosnowskyi TaxID=360622 RepID=A0AAD8HUQ6_9APIA|nr:Sulfoquinovosyldiacylglycerol 2 [Heracleum sosnowskyi]